LLDEVFHALWTCLYCFAKDPQPVPALQGGLPLQPEAAPQRRLDAEHHQYVIRNGGTSARTKRTEAPQRSSVKTPANEIAARG